MRAGVLALLLSVAFAASTRAHEASGCTGFAWPLGVELEWLKAAVPATPSGTTLVSVPDKAVDLSLAPANTVTLPTPPSGKPEGELVTPHAGFFAIERVAKAGLYQVSLSGPGWVDVIQNGKILPVESETGAQGCPVLEKSTRLKLAEGPATIEMSSVPDGHIKLTIRLAEH